MPIELRSRRGEGGGPGAAAGRADAGRHRRRRATTPRGRPVITAPARLGGRQPARERREVLRRQLARRPSRSTPRDDAAVVPCADHGIGIPTPGPRAGLRALLPGRPGPQPGDRRDRARPGHRPPRGHEPTGRGHGASPRRARARPSRCGCRSPRRPVDAHQGGRCDGWTGHDRAGGRGRGVVRRRALRSGSQGGLPDPGGPRRRRGARRCSTSSQPDLVLLDLMLPKVSGIDVCRELRAALDGPDHHGHGQGRRDRHGRRASRSAPTTTSPSRTGCGSWWPACGPCSGGAPSGSIRSPSTASKGLWRSATCASTRSATR